MLKYCFAAALACSAGAALAQPAPSAAPTGPQAAVQQAAMAFGQCVNAGMQVLPASVTPEAGATTVLGGCATQRQSLQRAAEALIATLPEEQKAMANEQLRTQLGAAETHVAAAIRQQRAAATAAPAQ